MTIGNHHAVSNLIVHGVRITDLQFGVPMLLDSDHNFTITGGGDFHDVKKGPIFLEHLSNIFGDSSF